MSPEGTEWHMSLTYVELYNDGWRDLLAASSQPNQRLLPSEQAEVRREQAAINLRETKGAKGAVATSYLTGSTTFRTKITSKAQLLQVFAATLPALDDATGAPRDVRRAARARVGRPVRRRRSRGRRPERVAAQPAPRALEQSRADALL